jgi:radical SAM/Cys-rich protein
MSLIKSLQQQANPLSQPAKQLELLDGGVFENGELPRFKEKLREHGLGPIKPKALEVFQMNLGYMCNQTCKHCHVDAGPDRKEIMTQATMEQCLDVLKQHPIHTLDLTGGAPEMNPNFRWLIEQARPLVKEIIVRSNLTILRANEHYKTLPAFFAQNHIRVVSSLPFYAADKTDRQRGNGVFNKSIEALKTLNALGYGQEETGLMLDLVYNPVGAFLPAPQEALEHDFKTALREQFDVRFNQLLCITNLPISRYLEYLIRTDNYEEYMDKLVEAFNPAAVGGVMCTNTLSIGWNGQLYDCDFNQMLEMPLQNDAPQHIGDFDLEALQKRNIAVHQHCYGCTAGAGSSCQGTLV